MSSGLSETVLAFRRNNGKGENAVLCFGSDIMRKTLKTNVKHLSQFYFRSFHQFLKFK